MKGYSVRKLSKLAGVSVRTLHHYDQIGLLQPSTRTEAGYRLYTEKELLRLQQILFYKELDFPLQEIRDILDDPDFDLVQALKSHKKALQCRRDRIATLLVTIDKTIVKLKSNAMLNDEELYEGLPKEKAAAYKKEAQEKWGKDAVEKSENYLRQLSKQELGSLKADFERLGKKLASMVNEDPASPGVQEEVARHYAMIRQFWGTATSSDSQAEAYKGLGEMYVSDERYTTIDGNPHPEFASFMCKAMQHFADTRLK